MRRTCFVLGLAAMLILPSPIDTSATAALAAEPGSTPPAIVVSSAEVFATTATESHRYTARVTSPAEVALVPRVSGEILGVGFKNGERVNKGTILYRIDPVRYEAAVKTAEGELVQARAEYAYARSDLARNQVLNRQNATSRNTLEQAEKAERAAWGKILSAEGTLATARDDLKNTNIIAPIAGRVGVTALTAGNYVTPASGTLVTLIQTDPVRVRFAMSVKDIAAEFGSEEILRERGEIRLRLADGTSYDEVGGITFIDNAANGRTDTVYVFSDLPNTRDRLVIGSTIVVTLLRRGDEERPAVLPSAVLHDETGAFVYVVNSASKAERRAVILGPLAGEAQIVTSGLSIGETVITDGTHKIRNGLPVEARGR